MSIYNNNREWADKFLDIQKKIIYKNGSKYDYNKFTRYGKCKYDYNADCKENTDILLYAYNKLRFALRVRNLQSDFFTKNKQIRELTIRSKSLNDGYTEINKILDGWGDYMLYCWGNDEEINNIDYILFDLDDFRKNHLNWLIASNVKNKDNTFFNIYSISEIKLIDKNLPRVKKT